MKRQIKVGKAGMALGLVLFGLAITGPVLSTRAADASASDTKATLSVGLTQFNSELFTLRDSVSSTMSALQEIKTAASADGDLAKPYGNFTTALGNLNAIVEKVRVHGLTAKTKAKETWAAWQNELTSMQNASLREKAQNRYTATSKQFDRIVQKADAAKTSFAPLMADLKDIDTYLKADLSKDAVSSLSSTIWKMGNTAKGVDSKLEDVIDEINKTLKKMPAST